MFWLRDESFGLVGELRSTPSTSLGMICFPTTRTQNTPLLATESASTTAATLCLVEREKLHGAGGGVCGCVWVCEGDTEKERKREIKTEKERERKRERDREKDRAKDRARDRERESERERQREKESSKSVPKKTQDHGDVFIYLEKEEGRYAS